MDKAVILKKKFSENMETVNEKDYEYANHVGYKLINKMGWEGMYQKTNSASTLNQSGD